MHLSTEWLLLLGSKSGQVYIQREKICTQFTQLTLLQDFPGIESSQCQIFNSVLSKRKKKKNFTDPSPDQEQEDAEERHCSGFSSCHSPPPVSQLVYGTRCLPLSCATTSSTLAQIADQSSCVCLCQAGEQQLRSRHTLCCPDTARGPDSWQQHHQQTLPQTPVQ